MQASAKRLPAVHQLRPAIAPPSTIPDRDGNPARFVRQQEGDSFGHVLRVSIRTIGWKLLKSCSDDGVARADGG